MHLWPNLASSSCDMSSVKSPQPQQRLSTATLDITKSPAFLKLKAELDSAKEQLQSKEEQVDKLSKIRDEVIRRSLYGIMNRFHH